MKATTKRKAGRPRLPDDERMDRLLKIRLTAAQQAELDRAAGGDTSTWARETLLRAAKRR